MSGFNWTRFLLRVNINAPVNELYDAWATQKGIEHWFLRLSAYTDRNGRIISPEERVEAGYRYKWLWWGWDDDTVEHGEILYCNGRDSIKFSFGKAGVCTVRIYKEKGITIVELLQEEIPDDEKGKQYWHVGCKTGWAFYLANMKSLFEGGIDLRNRDADLREMLNS